ncbi:MAG: hypothetical protein LUF35_05905 [Lachnospiraceae bacterium]|nr:hypothetical protein [Lachnospiraceae bacterium]
MDDSIFSDMKSSACDGFHSCSWTDEIGQLYESKVLARMTRAIDQMSDLTAEVTSFIRRVDEEMESR